jgi:anti-sigma regulatory factor (Ser/Thr protein kinase)
MKKPLFQRRYTCNASHISTARTDVVTALQATGRVFKPKLLDFEIAIGELLQNIVRHEICSNPPCEFTIDVSFSGSNLHLVVTDTCSPLQEVSFLNSPRVPTELGGMGINIINKLASIYVIKPDLTGNSHELYFTDFLTST